MPRATRLLLAAVMAVGLSGAMPANATPASAPTPANAAPALATAPTSVATAKTQEWPTVGAAVRGADLSWPNCPVGMGVPGRRTLGLPLPRPAAEFWIIGLTNGRAFTANPCLASQVRKATRRDVLVSAYTMLSYPNKAERKAHRSQGPFSTDTYAGRLSNVGYAQTVYALDAMDAAGLDSPFVWVDVEPRAERAWSLKVANNNALIAGALRAIADRDLGAGIYTYARAWTAITGDLQLDVPLWAPGHSHASTYAARRAQTLASCSRDSFTGGPLVLTQWVWNNRDHDITCPAITTVTQPLWADLSAG